MVLLRPGGPPPGTRPGPEQLVREQIGLAIESLAQSDYQAALSRAEAALALAPGNIEAERIRDAAQAGLARSVVADNDVSSPAAAVESPAPVAAPTPSVETTPPPTVPVPQRVTPPQPAPAPAPPPASAASTELRPTAEPAVSPAVPPTDEPQPTSRRETEPTAEPASVPATVPSLDPPTPVAEPDVSPAALDPQVAERQIRQTLATFAQAIEQKDITLYRSVRPSLSADEERRLEAGFAAVESQQVELQILSIDVFGDHATVRVSRRDIIQIGGGEQIADTMQTITLRRLEDGWMIEEIES